MAFSLNLVIQPIAIRSLIIGTAGGTLLGAIGIPGGWIAGAMLSVAAAALSGLEVGIPVWLQRLGFLAVGISMGSGVTPQTVAQLPSWPITMALVILSIPLIASVVSLYLIKGAGWNKATALLSSMPGALSFLVSLAPSTDADVSRVAVLQTTRVAILVAVLPLAALWLSEPVEPHAPTPLAGLDHAIILYAAGIGGAVLAHIVRVPGGLLVGGLFASALLHGGGLVEGRPPGWLDVFGFITLGTLIGSRFAGKVWTDLGAIMGVSLSSFALSASLAVLMALIGTLLTDFSLLKLIIAFAPGGLEAMVILAFAMDLDPAFVAAHHLTRFLLIALTVPFLVRYFGVSLTENLDSEAVLKAK